MKKLLGASVALAMMATPAFAADVKLGIILGYTGPIESLTPDMAMGAELAISEVNASGAFMNGAKSLLYGVIQLVLILQPPPRQLNV